MKKSVINLLLVFASLLFSVLAMELFFRLADGEYRFIDFLGEERTLFRSAYPSEYDPRLGWIPLKGQTTHENVWGTTVTILDHGIRSNGLPGPEPAGPPILAVGDSFTFGDEVSDPDTWPAQLEKTLRRRVINAGVFGYGLDQSYLRAMLLAEIYKPEILILGFIADDIARCELSSRSGAPKPYFLSLQDRLILKNVPVPRPSHSAHQGTFRSVFGRSYMVHRLMMRCCSHWWLMGVTWDTFYSQYRVHAKGEEVACRILADLDGFARRAGIRNLYLLIQYTKEPRPEDLQMVDRLLKGCPRGDRIRVVDLRTPLAQVRARDPQRYGRFYDRHMTAEGNRFVAERLAEAIKLGSQEAGKPGG